MTAVDVAALRAFRQALHRLPEVSGEETRTAQTVATMLQDAGADDILTGLGGHGVAGVFRGAAPGPRVLFRAELGALPIQETGQAAWRSQVAGKGHQRWS